MLESEIQRRIVAAILKEFRLFTLIIKQAGETGYPDLCVILPDQRVVWLETKRPGKAPEPRQALIHKRLRYAGHRVHVVTHVPQALRIIREELNRE